MRIEGGMAASVQLQPAAGAQDGRIKAIEQQMKNVREQLQKIRQDRQLSSEEKDKRKKVLEDELAQLQQELSQTKQEIRREQQERREAQNEQAAGANGQEQEESDKGMVKDLLTLSHSYSELKDMKTVRDDLERRLKTMRAELKQDSLNGGKASEDKQRRISEMEQRIEKLGYEMGEKSAEINAHRKDEDTEEAGKTGEKQEQEKTAEAEREEQEREKTAEAEREEQGQEKTAEAEREEQGQEKTAEAERKEQRQAHTQPPQSGPAAGEPSRRCYRPVDLYL